jgi:hypothetical protein
MANQDTQAFVQDLLASISAWQDDNKKPVLTSWACRMPIGMKWQLKCFQEDRDRPNCHRTQATAQGPTGDARRGFHTGGARAGKLAVLLAATAGLGLGFDLGVIREQAGIKLEGLNLTQAYNVAIRESVQVAQEVLHGMLQA